MMHPFKFPSFLPLAGLICLLAGVTHTPLHGQPKAILDIAQLGASTESFSRVSGSRGRGNLGLPVAGPGDLDGDGFPDLAVAFMRANVLGRSGNGEVNIVFGDGNFGHAIDTAINSPNLLRIAGDVQNEAAGNEIWIGDVTGDAIDDLLVARQNFTPSQDRIGAGALSIIVGGPQLRAFAASRQFIDLRNPPASLQILTLVGKDLGDRLGIWMRIGDVDGDGIGDLVVGADQEDEPGQGLSYNSGAVYVVRGGPHLADSLSVDLRTIPGTPLEGHVIHIVPPAGSSNFRTGATCHVFDLDGNGKAEVLAAATLNRSGATIQPAGGTRTSSGSGGAPRGWVFIAWDDNFPDQPWTTTEMNFADLPGSGSILKGGGTNRIFGEEIVGGLDFDGNETQDLFVGDFLADESPGTGRPNSGTGYVFFNAHLLKNQIFTLPNLPEGVGLTAILGPEAGGIASDTAAVGDFNGDGLGDLAVGTPHSDPQGRRSAGSVHVVFGQEGGWPAVIDTRFEDIPPPEVVQVTEIQGARGARSGDQGDTLCYSASAGDLDGDGLTDLIVNEMVGNGIAPGAIDVGNLVAFSGTLLSDTGPRLLFAQYGSGNVDSELLFSNPSEALEKAAHVAFFDDEGDPLSSSVVLSGDAASGVQGQGGVVVAESLDIVIAPLGKVSIRTSGGENTVGSVVVTPNSRLGGILRFDIPGIGIAGVPASRPVPGFIVPVRSDGVTDTGLALMNPSPQFGVTVDMTLLDETGNPIGGAEFSVFLQPRGHAAQFLTEMFGETVSLPFNGSLVARARAGTVAALAVEFGTEAGQFTTLTVTPLDVD